MFFEKQDLPLLITLAYITKIWVIINVLTTLDSCIQIIWHCDGWKQRSLVRTISKHLLYELEAEIVSLVLNHY